MGRFSRHSITSNSVPNSPYMSADPHKFARLSRTKMSQESDIQPDVSRPMSVATDSSFEVLTAKPIRPKPPPPAPGPQSPARSNLSRTDQIVLRHFWNEKLELNKTKNLHLLKFPALSQHPGHHELVPVCEVYYMIRNTPGANIISMGSANGTYIGFELKSDCQLIVDVHDEWAGAGMSHHIVTFKKYDVLLKDPGAEMVLNTWPKPLTIEFLDDQFQRWRQEMMSFCWDVREVRKLVDDMKEDVISDDSG